VVEAWTDRSIVIARSVADTLVNVNRLIANPLSCASSKWRQMRQRIHCNH
jgi:hypothetical protein